VLLCLYLEAYLWESANFLRGPLDAADFKPYIFPLLFFKRTSDAYERNTRSRWRSPAETWTLPSSPRTIPSRVWPTC
jgi:type I restriction-modification system DNA methylase subunit